MNDPITIPFNRPVLTGLEYNSMKLPFDNNQFSGDGLATKKCHAKLEQTTQCKKALLTTSCTDALELAALTLNIEQNDEIIMPSYTFVSTANAFALRGARIVFVDINPKTMNICPEQIEKAISNKTKAIVVVHYAGVSCDMDQILTLSQKYNLPIIEDAAQCIEAYYNNQHLGSIGNFGTLSFHETKNIHCGEGGAILINDNQNIEHCEISREKGTNRSQFLRGQIDKYTWRSLGSSFLPNELTAAFLLPQLDNAKKITKKRLSLWDRYKQGLADLTTIELPFIPKYAKHNAHMFYIKTKDINERSELIKFLRENGIQSAFHYVPLHSSDAGKKLGRFNGEDKYTTLESERLLRLPLYFDLEDFQVDYITEKIKLFYKDKK